MDIEKNIAVYTEGNKQPVTEITALSLPEYRKAFPGRDIRYFFSTADNMAEKDSRLSTEFLENCRAADLEPDDYCSAWQDEYGTVWMLVAVRTRNRKYPCILVNTKAGTRIKCSKKRLGQLKRLDSNEAGNIEISSLVYRAMLGALKDR